MRKDTWRQELVAYVASVAARPFAPGAHDCARFAAGAVEAMTGDRHGADIAYGSLAEGRRALKAAGHGSMAAYLAARFEEVPGAFGQPGDVAVMKGRVEALGIVQGEMIYVLRVDGLGLVPLTEAARCFRV
jgi:hypothetical protein